MICSEFQRAQTATVSSTCGRCGAPAIHSRFVTDVRCSSFPATDDFTSFKELFIEACLRNPVDFSGMDPGSISHGACADDLAGISLVPNPWKVSVLICEGACS